MILNFKKKKKYLKLDLSWRINSKHYFGDWHVYEALHDKLVNRWWNAFQDLKSAPSSNLRAKQDALLLVIKKAAEGKHQDFPDKEVLIPQAKKLHKNLETAKVKLKTAVSLVIQTYNKLDEPTKAKKYPTEYNKGLDLFKKWWNPLVEKNNKLVIEIGKADKVRRDLEVSWEKAKKANKKYHELIEEYRKNSAKMTRESQAKKMKEIGKQIGIEIIRKETLKERNAIKKAIDDIFSTVPTSN